MRALPNWLVTTLSVLLVLSAWILVTQMGWVRDLFLPGPRDLWLGFEELWEDGYKGRSLFEHLGMSLLRVGAGFLTGAIAGTALGLAMGMSRRLDAAAAPFIEFLRPLPQLAYLVLLIVWLGIGEASKITMLFLAALPVAAVAARDGVRNIPPERIRMAESLGASRGQIFRHVIAPSALAEILTGARLALGIVYGTLIASEIIAGSNGIGWMILDAGRFLRSDYAFVGILVIGVTGVLIDRLLLWLERRVVHWAGR
ncbi:ABC transporter permease [Paracraurococcus lichenis]|uniref:ABC transporter permease n=1 Tax=Paracraurococcus lichenis TaxID=3064888 RepID=A0ABT9DZS5_9PROT|nr:ABC transporter permease [Paracraurococcus sp. LOR1-02]MDO9709385.1 ABC transporter permease [Paracraurococcus sp. LOR1-02]